MAEPDVLVAMPVFRGVDHLPETLRSVREQAYPHFRVLVSVDGGDTASYEVCRAVADEDPRFEVVLQEEQLGWPGNFNWIVARCDLPFVTYWQQDDLASTGYLGALRAALLSEPEASLAFTDVQWFGDKFDRSSMPSVTGSPLERVLQQFDWSSYIPLRGLIRTAMLDDRDEAIHVTGELSSHEEYVMLSQLAAHGPLTRVANAMSFKRAHPGATTNRMYERPLHRRVRAWAGMGARTFLLALELAPPGSEGRLLATMLDRLAITRPGRGMFFEVEQSLAAVREMALAVAEQAGIDLADERWLVAPGTGLERPIHPLVHEALAAERDRAARLRDDDPPLAAFLGRGWWEPEAWGAWTRGEHATVELGQAGGDVRLEGRVFAPDGPVRVGWSLDGEERDLREVAAGEPVVVEASVPPGAARLHLHLPDARSPVDAGVSTDNRPLGFGLERVRRL